jgi:hypothetical protein
LLIVANRRCGGRCVDYNKVEIDLEMCCYSCIIKDKCQYRCNISKEHKEYKQKCQKKIQAIVKEITDEQLQRLKNLYK